MALPEQVIEQLGRESVKTPGWSSGILFFSGTILGIMVVIYLGITFGYEPYLNGGIAQTKTQMATLSQSISSADQAKLVTYYSQVSNLQALVAGHVFLSPFFAWLEENTEANVYYGSLSFSSRNQVNLNVFARTQADVNQQIATFESSGDVKQISLSNVSFSPSAGAWMFSATFTLDPSLFLWHPVSATTISLGIPTTTIGTTTATTSLATATGTIASTTTRTIVATTTSP